MFYNKSDRDNVQKVLSSCDGNRIQLHNISSELADLCKTMRRLESITEQLSNDFETLKFKMNELDKRLMPKLPTTTTQPQKPKTKK